MTRQTASVLALLSGTLLSAFVYFRIWDSYIALPWWYIGSLFLISIGLRAIFPTTPVEGAAGIGLGTFLAVVVDIALMMSRDPGCCNLFPISIVVVFLVGLPGPIVGLFTGYLLSRTKIPQSFYSVPLILSLAIPTFYPYIDSAANERLQTETIPRLMNEIYEAQIAYSAGRPDGTFACDGKDLPGVGNLGWGHVAGRTVNNLLTVRYYSIELTCFNDVNPPDFRITARSYTARVEAPRFSIDATGQLEMGDHIVL